MKMTKVTKIPRATEKKRRYDDAIRKLRELSRDIQMDISEVVATTSRTEMLEAAALSFASDVLEEARD